MLRTIGTKIQIAIADLDAAMDAGRYTFVVDIPPRFQADLALKNIGILKILNWSSFIVAVFLAFYILHIKRTYFRLGYFETFLKDLHTADPELDRNQLVRRFTRDIGSKFKRVWILGLIIVLIGVVYFWLTFDAMNMHIYFVVGLYSLVINYPRTDLFSDIPYLLKEIFQEETAPENPPETEEKNS